mmetsp:Transcript_7241/g.20415  ORF Transcript_7241/g.20415 Transcript_7241/m.20415 type:complete len:303 (-) Transcript_7241:33-941(-)
MATPSCRRHLSRARAAAVLLHVRLPHPLRGPGEGDALALGEDRRLELVGHGGVHDGAVPVAVHVGFEPLAWVAPAHAACLAARHRPPPETLELLPHKLGVLRCDQVDKRIAEPGLPREVRRKVHKVIPPGEAACVQQLQQHVARVVVGNVPQHHRGPTAFAAAHGPCAVEVLGGVIPGQQLASLTRLQAGFPDQPHSCLRHLSSSETCGLAALGDVLWRGSAARSCCQGLRIEAGSAQQSEGAERDGRELGTESLRVGAGLEGRRLRLVLHELEEGVLDPNLQVRDAHRWKGLRSTFVRVAA